MAATYFDKLKGLNAYPIPLRALQEIADRYGIVLTDEVTQEEAHGKTYNLAVAEVLLWLSLAPNVTQGGQSYSFPDEQRTQLRNRANQLFNEYGAEDAPKPVFGYKGSKL